MSQGNFMYQEPGDEEVSVDLVIPGAVDGPTQSTDNSSSRNNPILSNRLKTVGKISKGRTWKLGKWHYLSFLIGLIIIAAVIVVVVVFSKHGPQILPGLKENVSRGRSGINENYAERFAAIANNSIDPCQDFNTFVCNKRSSESVDGNNTLISSTFSDTAEAVLLAIRPLLEEPISNYEPRSVRMAKQLYKDCMQNTTSFSSHYNNWSWMDLTNDEQFTLETQLAQIFAHNDDSIFSLEVTEDEDSSLHLLTFNKGQPVPELLADSETEQVVTFEKNLRKLWEESKCEEDKRDVWSGRNNYRNFTLGFIQTQIPQINWAGFVQHLFHILGLKGKVSSEMKVQFRCFNFFRGLGTLIQEAGLGNVSNYMVTRYGIDNLVYLDHELIQYWSDSEDLQENEDELRHLRWKNCARIVKDGFGVALAHLYQRKDPKTRTIKVVQEMTQYLKRAFRHAISNQAWMPAKGKDQFQKQLIEKLMQMRIKIGYPEYIKNATVVDEYYKDLALNESSFMLNVLKMKKFLALKKFEPIHEKSDRDMEPRVDPMEVGAFYVLPRNQILIPVGLLHKPMFDEDYPMYLNFANLGFALAHEMFHGFDNDGLHHDKNGNFTSWWPHDSKIAFKNQATCFVEQYGKFQIPLIDQFVDGNETLSENICDNAGFPLILMAYEMWAKDHNVQEQLLPGLNFTIPQIFHIAFGQMFCETPSEETSQAYTQDVHSPYPLRVVGVVQNSANFRHTFNCPAGSPMTPTRKCSLWS